MAETRRLASEYHTETGQVLPVSNELARYDVAHILGCKELEEPLSGVDLIGGELWPDLKVQVKARVIFDSSKNRQRIGQINPDGLWDSVVLVIMDERYEPYEMYMASREILLEEINRKKSNRANRGSMSLSKFKILSERVWSK